MSYKIQPFFDQLKQFSCIQENLESFNKKCQKIIQRGTKNASIVCLVEDFFVVPELDDIDEEVPLNILCKNILRILPKKKYSFDPDHDLIDLTDSSISSTSPTPEEKIAEFKEKMDEYLYGKNELHHRIVFSELPALTPKFYSLDGMPQSGKAATLVYFMLSAVFSFQKCILITRNISADIPQMENTMKRIAEESYQKSKEMGYTNYPQLIWTTNPDFPEWSNPNSLTRIMIIMGNHSQANKALTTLNSAKNIEYNVFIDEADQVVNTEKTSVDKSFRPVLEEIISKSKRTICCTATPLGMVFNDKFDVMCSDLLHLLIKPNYHGLEQIRPVFLDTTQQYHSQYEKDIFEVDDCLKDYLEDFSRRLFFVKEEMPAITLIKNSLSKKHHREVYDYCCKTYPKITPIIYDGSQTKLGGNCPNLKKIIINKKTYKNDTNSYNLKGITIQNVLQYLKDNGGYKMFPRIVIISGKLADRGLNFSSTDYKWHLTEQYYRTGKSSNMPTLIQSMRIFGLSPNNIQRVLYTTEDIYNDIKKQYDITERFFVDAKAKKHQEKPIIVVLSKKTIHKSDLPSRNITKSNKYPFKVSNEKEISGESNYEEGNICLIIECMCTVTEQNIITKINEYILNEGLTGWVPRAEILKAITSNNVRHQAVSSQLTHIFKYKTCAYNENTEKDIEKGTGKRLLVRKKKNCLVDLKLYS